VGGAIYNNNGGGNFSVSGSTFSNNTANGSTGGGAIFNSGVNATIYSNNFNNNEVSYGGAICNYIWNGVGGMLVSGNVMSGNVAIVSGQMIYNNGTMGVLNLTFINNSTLIVRNGSTITIYATLLDDMGNTVTAQNISFYLDGVLFENIESIEGLAEFNYTVDGLPGSLIPVNGSYAGIGDFDIIINEGQLRIPKLILVLILMVEKFL